MTDPLFQPTPLQADQSALAQADLLEAMDALKRGGVDWRVILAGAFGAVTHLIAAHAGETEVFPNYARWAAATMNLGKGK